MHDSIAVIGTYDSDANAAYVFAPVDSSSLSSSSTSWTLTAKLTGSTYSFFGYSVAVTGNWIVVGAWTDDNTNGNDAGAVSVFTKTSSSSSSSSTWMQMMQLLASDGAADDHFGISMSISKDASTIVVGANLVDFNSNVTNSGAAYMFRNINSTTTLTSTVQWTQMGKFVAADPDTGDGLGISIAMENNIVVVGAYGDDSNTGSVYVVDTGLASPPTTAPTTTTPVTPEPTRSPTPNPTMPPSSDNDSSSTPPTTTTNSPSSTVSLPPTTTPTPSNIDTDLTNSPIPNNNSTTQQPQQTDSDSGFEFSAGAIVGVAAIVGAVVLGIAFFNYCIKLQREAREQQQQHEVIPPPPPPPPPSSSSNIPATENTAAAADDETTTPIMADAVVLVVPPPAQEVHDETLQAAAFLDPATAAVAVVAKTAAAAAAAITTPTKKGLPRYKDQVRAVQPPGPSATNLPSLPKRNHQIHDQDDFPRQNKYPKEEEKEEEKEQSLEDQPPAVLPQQQQNKPPILHPDPPAAINYEQQQQQHGRLLNYKDQFFI
jgi:hypothetical protein